MICINCRESIPSKARFCPFCGAEQVITQALIQAAANRDQSAIAALYDHTYNAVFASVKSMIEHDDDTVLDIVQDAYIKGFQSLDQLESPQLYRAWMKRIAINKAKDWLKRKKPMLFSDMASEDDDSPELQFEDDRTENLPDVVIDQQETVRLMQEILSTLSEEQRTVVAMFYYDEMSVREIAGILECSEGTVKSRLNYARKKIKAQVEELERKGTKLYGISAMPLLMLLLRNLEQVGEASRTTILEGIQSALLPGTAGAATAAAGGASQAGSAATAGAAATAKAVSAAVGKSLAVKITASILAGVVFLGSGAAVAKMAIDRRSAVQTAQVQEVSEEEPVPAEDTTEHKAEEATQPPPLPTEETPTEAKVEEAPTNTPDMEQAKPEREAYAQVLRDYQSLMNTEHIDDSVERQSERNMDLLLMSEYKDSLRDGTCRLSYAFYDINHDGTEELILSIIDVGEKATDLSHGRPISAIHTFDGQNQKLASGWIELGLERTSFLLDDGSVVKLGYGFLFHGSPAYATIYKMTNSGLFEECGGYYPYPKDKSIDIEDMEALVNYRGEWEYLDDSGAFLSPQEGLYHMIDTHTVEDDLVWTNLSGSSDFHSERTDSETGSSGPAPARLQAVYDIYADHLRACDLAEDPEHDLASYAVVDMNRDGIPELVTRIGNYPDESLCFYTIREGELSLIDTIEARRSYLYQDGEGNVILQWAFMAGEEDWLVIYDGTGISLESVYSANRQDGSEYTQFPVDLESDTMQGLDLTPLTKACGMDR